MSSSKAHHYRASLLLGSETAYQPLSDHSAFSSQQPPIYNPRAPPHAYQAGGYHDREGLQTQDVAALGPAGIPARMYIPNTTWTWTFMLVVLVQAIASLALEAYVFGEFQSSLRSGAANEPSSDKEPTKTIPTYLALFIFGFLYQLVLAWDALRLKNTIQVIGICLYNLGMLIYASVEMDQVNDAVNSLQASGMIATGTWYKLKAFLIAAPCVIALGTLVLAFVAWKLYHEFAWTIYKHISADLRLKRRYLTYQIYIALLKFDFFFFLGFTVQFLVVVTNTSDTEFYLTIAAVPVTIVLLLLAAWFTRRESYLGQAGIIIVYFAAMAYFIFKLVRMYTRPREQDYLAARSSLTTFAVLTLILLIVTIPAAFLCMRNFNKGLMPHIQRRKKQPGASSAAGDPFDAGKWAGAPADYAGTPHQLGQVPTRMTID